MEEIKKSNIVRIEREGKTWYKASEVGKFLGLTNIYRDVVKLGGSKKFVVPTRGGNQLIVFVPEDLLEDLKTISQKVSRRNGDV